MINVVDSSAVDGRLTRKHKTLSLVTEQSGFWLLASLASSGTAVVHLVLTAPETTNKHQWVS